MLKDEDDSYGADFCPRTYFGGRRLVPVGEDELTDNPAVHPHQPYIVTVYRTAVCRRIKTFSRHKLCSHYYILPSIFMAWLLTAFPPVLMGKKPSGHPSLATRDGTHTDVAHAKQLSLLAAP